MGYRRVLPRDAFNEANLLKCIGFIALYRPNLITENVPYFDIVQKESDDSIHCTNVWFKVGKRRCLIHRPINSRRPFPVYVTIKDEDIYIFDDDGLFSKDILKLLEPPCDTSTSTK